MSQANVDNLRAFWETWNPSEAPDLSLLDPDATYEDTVLPDHIGETDHGHEGFDRALTHWFEPYEEVTIELEEIVGTGDRLVSIHRDRVKARHTGIELALRFAYAWTFRGGKVIQCTSFLDPEQALKAVGLEA